MKINKLTTEIGNYQVIKEPLGSPYRIGSEKYGTQKGCVDNPVVFLINNWFRLSLVE